MTRITSPPMPPPTRRPPPPPPMGKPPSRRRPAAAAAAVLDLAPVEPGLGVVAHADCHPFGGGHCARVDWTHEVRHRLSPDVAPVRVRSTSSSRSLPMITAHHLEVRAGARLLMDDVSFRVAAGDKVGLVGRNGAGKTTLTKILAGEALPASGTVTRAGERRLPAPGPAHRRPRGARAAPHPVRARPRRRSYGGCARPRWRWARDDPDGPRPRRCGATRRPTPPCTPAAATPPRPRPGRSRRASDIEDRILEQPLRTLSGGQRRRVELARILFSGAETLLLDEPTNHLDADSIGWLRDFLKCLQGRADRDQPRRRSCSRRASTRCCTSTPTAPRSTSTTWAGRRTSRSARPTRSAASASG